jgi:hypothetical protein
LICSWKGIGRELFVREDEGGGEHFGSTLLLVDEVGKEVTAGAALDDQLSSTRVAKSGFVTVHSFFEGKQEGSPTVISLKLKTVQEIIESNKRSKH